MTDLFDFKASSRDYAVMGNPISHSRSPDIHRLFGEQLNIGLSYDRIQVDPGGFQQAVSHFQAHGGAGLNITVPFKVEAWKLCSQPGNRLSERASMAESVNTLRFPDEQVIEGDNTDGIGIVRDIQNNLGYSLQGGRILLIGAGGAARGVLGPILECAPAFVQIVNRTASRAVAMAGHFMGLGCQEISGGAFDTAEGAYDLIINGTAASLDGELPDISPECFGCRTLVYDMMYGTEPTPFMRWSLEQGASKASDGLGMLVEQAAESFYIWHGVRPETSSVLDALKHS